MHDRELDEPVRGRARESGPGRKGQVREGHGGREARQKGTGHDQPVENPCGRPRPSGPGSCAWSMLRQVVRRGLRLNYPPPPPLTTTTNNNNNNGCEKDLFLLKYAADQRHHRHKKQSSIDRSVWGLPTSCRQACAIAVALRVVNQPLGDRLMGGVAFREER